MTKLSKETLTVLKNFSSINANVVLKPGKQIKTIGESKNILAIASIEEDLPSEVGIYDLNEFLGVLGLLSDPQLEFKDKYVRVSEGNRSIDYFFSEVSNLTTPPDQDLPMPEPDLTLQLSAEVLSDLKRASSGLGHTKLVITPNGKLKVQCKDDATSNSYTIQLEDSDFESATDNPDQEFAFDIQNLKLLNGDYSVKLSSTRISHWDNINKPVEYFVALEH